MKNEEYFWKEWQEALSFPFPENYFKGESWHQNAKMVSRGPITDFHFVRREEFGSIIWIARMIGYPEIYLAELLGGIRRGRVFYCQRRKRKKDGSYRIIFEPKPELKRVQKMINRKLLSELPRKENVHGFSGGNIFEAVKPHLGSRCWVMFDIKNAFPSVSSLMVMRCLAYKNQSISAVKYLRFRKKERVGYFSWNVSNIIRDLCVLDKKLPQGTSTSPRLFDLVFGLVIDGILSSSFSNSDVIYTRYADNIFLSSREDIPRRMILQKLGEIEKRGFGWHKLKFVYSCEEAIRMLGLNLIKGKLHNTRAFKRRLRLMVYHIEWLKKNDGNFGDELEKLSGMMSFAVKDTLPEELVKQAMHILKTF